MSAFLGVGRTSIYRYIRYGKIKAVRFDGKTLIRRSDIDKMFDYITVSEKNKPKEKVPITDFYTTAEIKENYNIQESWLYKIAKEHNIPHTFNRGRTIGVRSISTPTLPRKLLMRALQNGTAWRSCKRSSV